MSAPPRPAPPSELVLGYADPLTVHAGECLDVRVSANTDRYDASLVRLRSAGPGPEVAYDVVEELGSRETEAHERAVRNPGSGVVVGPAEIFGRLRTFTVSAWVMPTLLTETPQTILATLTADGTAGWSVVLDRESGVGLHVTGGAQAHVDAPIREGGWSHLLVCVDLEQGRVAIAQTPRSGAGHAVESALPIVSHEGSETITIGAPLDTDRPLSTDGNGCFNGKISSPTVYGGFLGLERAAEAQELAVADPDAPVVCRLDFSAAIDGQRFEDVSPHRHRAATINQPTAGVTGPNWRGGVSSYVEDRAQYSALHFHDDDLEDADWEIGIELDLPEDIEQGIYAARLSTGDCEDLVPFYVTAPGAGRANAALLIPTLTYLAYANEQEILSNPPSYTAFTGKSSDEAPLGWRDWLAVDEGLVSLYDVHRDGSTVSYASTRRPMLNMRPDYVWPLLDGPHGLAMDLRLTSCLDREGLSYDLLTDHDLHEHGRSALDPYRVIITGAHPEYWTGPMLDALDGYLEAGGRLAYLGGNGFFNVTGIDPERPHIAEVRRARVGSRPSSSAPGELWMTTSHEEGGMWRTRGRPPQAAVGVGTTAMGAGPGRPYVRTSASTDQAYAWIFEGVDEELICDGGFLGGAAAYEFDRADPALGTPEEAVVLATASGFRELYFPMLEEFVSSCPEVADPASPLVRADMVIAIDGTGGGYFSVGSAAWCGGLGGADERTSVAVVTANVVRRFAETPHGQDPLRRGAP